MTWTTTKYLATCTALLVATTALIRPASGEEGKIMPELPPDQTVMAILDELGDNQSAMLPQTKVIGEFNDEAKRHRLHETGPRGRDFSQKAAWAPDRKRALFCGAHAGVSHRLNDVWEYDLPANTWVMLYAPDPSVSRGNAEAFRTVREERTHRIETPDGTVEEVVIVRTKRGGPTVLAHTYWQLTYDPQRKVLLWMMPNWKSYEGNYKGPPLWSFNPWSREWAPMLIHGPRPTRGGAGAMEYIADMDGAVWHNLANVPGLRLFPSAENVVRNLAPNDGNYRRNKDVPGAQAILSYDPEHRILVAHMGRTGSNERRHNRRQTHHYDLDSNAWSLVVDEPHDSEAAPVGWYSRAAFGYDPVGKVHLRYDSSTPDSVWSYDVGERTWTRNKVNGPPGPSGRNLIGYMDPASNALVINDALDTWIYRYRAHQAPTTSQSKRKNQVEKQQQEP